MSDVKIRVKLVVSSSELDRFNRSHIVRYEIAFNFTSLILINVSLNIGHITGEKEQLKRVDLSLRGPVEHLIRQNMLELLTQLMVIDLFLLVALCFSSLLVGKTRFFVHISAGVRLLVLNSPLFPQTS